MPQQNVFNRPGPGWSEAIVRGFPIPVWVLPGLGFCIFSAGVRAWWLRRWSRGSLANGHPCSVKAQFIVIEDRQRSHGGQHG